MSATSNGTSTRERPRVFTGRSIEELIPQIEQELGQDAIVTRQRSGLGGGVAGFFQRPFVEIEAHPGHPRIDLYDEAVAQSTALPYAEPAPKHSAAVAADDFHEPSAIAAQQQLPSSLVDAPAAPRISERFATALAAAQAAAEQAPEATLPAPPTVEPPAQQPQQPHEHSGATAANPAPAPARSSAAARVRAKLLERGIEAELADELIELAYTHALASSRPQASVAEAVKAVLRRRIPTPEQWAATGTSVAVVGPPGAGKTSFCAALAGAYRERSTLAVACATLLDADSRGEHRLLLSPHLLKPTPATDEHAVDALARARSEGLLLLDTPSAPSSDRAATARLGALLKRLGPDHVVLALPATYSTKVGSQLLRTLRPLRPTSIVITHTQETDQLGAAVQTALGAGIAPAFLLDPPRTGGLLHTDPADLAQRLLG
jgi:flagellar biosynthesis protein FlhF